MKINLIRKDRRGEVTTYEYNYENRISRITYPNGRFEDFLCDYSVNLLIKKAKGETNQYVYGFGVAPVAEMKGPTGGPVTETTLFIQANGKTFEKLVNSIPSFMHTDALGSVVAISDGVGTVTATYEFEPYGKALYSTGSNINTYQFVGSYGVRNISGNKSVMGLRVYDQETGRFIQRDSIGFASGDINLYRHVKNNPLRMIDPWGLEEECTESKAEEWIKGLIEFAIELGLERLLIPAAVELPPLAIALAATTAFGEPVVDTTFDWLDEIVSEPHVPSMTSPTVGTPEYYERINQSLQEGHVVIFDEYGRIVIQDELKE